MSKIEFNIDKMNAVWTHKYDIMSKNEYLKLCYMSQSYMIILKVLSSSLIFFWLVFFKNKIFYPSYFYLIIEWNYLFLDLQIL